MDENDALMGLPLNGLGAGEVTIINSPPTNWVKQYLPLILFLGGLTLVFTVGFKLVSKEKKA